MNDSALIYQWLGYLSNPARKTEIHVELHPEKEIEFRAEYQRLTGHPLLLSGEKAPFYIWKPSVNKWGTQRRVYFFGEKESMPKTPDMFEVRTGRSKKSGHWRINSKDFLKIMFKNGFFIGNNTENSKSVKAKIPGRFIKHFNSGFKIATPEEFIEAEVRKHCNESGFRTFGEDIIAQLAPYGDGNIDTILDKLQEKGIVTKNSNHGTYTLKGLVLLDDEIEQPLIKQAIEGETHPEKREYLIETYSRNRGWSRLAKKTFGENCMCDNCINSFIKEDGTPYIEVHHIVPLHQGGEDGIWNLSVLCAHHHRMAHFARTRDKTRLKKFLLEKNNEICNA